MVKSTSKQYQPDILPSVRSPNIWPRSAPDLPQPTQAGQPADKMTITANICQIIDACLRLASST